MPLGIRTIFRIMKKKFVILLAALMGVGAVFTPSGQAISFEVSIGDRPYYEGRDYWDWGWHWVWVPGHWYHRRWIHGYYVRQGEWRREYLRHRHNWRHHDRH